MADVRIGARGSQGEFIEILMQDQGDGTWAEVVVLGTGGAPGSVAVTDVIPGVGPTNLGKAEDAPHASGDVGVMALAVRSDTPAATGADGDYEPLQTTGGRLHVTQSDVQKDDIDKMAVSLYANGAGAAGDTPLLCHVTRGQLVHHAADGSNLVDGSSNTVSTERRNNGQEMIALPHPYLFNSLTWDRQRNNEELTLLASAARTLETDSADQINYNGSGLIVVVSVTLDPAAAAITPELQIKDSISGAYFTVWTAAGALSAVGTYAYLFAPGGAAGSYTEAVNLRLARTWRLQMNVADADSMTYSVSAVVLV